MRTTQTGLLLLLAATLAVAGYLTLRSFELFGAARLADVKPVPAGSQEIAYIGTASAGDTWERLVEAVRRVQAQWAEQHPKGPTLRADLDRAFPELTTDVPEICLWPDGPEGARLWVRWYKISSETDGRGWVQKLARRDRPPLAVLGGDTTGRALTLARALKEQQGRWHGADPVLLITTATADRYCSTESLSSTLLTDPDLPKLMQVYPGRSFRFAFTNSRMVEVVLDFVQLHPEVWTPAGRDFALAAAVAAGGPLAGPAALAARDQPPPSMYALGWTDDAYSKDLSDRFLHVFSRRFPQPGNSNSWVGYGTGDFYNPNPQEEQAVAWFFVHNPGLADERLLLVLPTGTVRARRFLRTLVSQAPLSARNLVVLSGDSISFNQVYRDRDVAWNIQDVPVPLIFFSHRNPTDAAAGFRTRADAEHPWATTGTQDLLLYRDVLESVVNAVYHDRDLVADADELNQRLHHQRWRKGRIGVGAEGLPFFDEDGNRSPGTGEHVIWVQPVRDGTRVLPRATLTVWRLGVGDDREQWRLLDTLHMQYDKAGPGY